MKHETSRPFVALASVVALLGTSGCGTLFDVAYLIGSKHYEERQEERKPTGQVNTAIEYESVVAPDGQIRVTCEERERRIERSFSVNKTYEYRGGYTRNTYIIAAVLSAVAGGAYAGIIAMTCNSEPKPGAREVKQFACVNALYATPFAADVGWSIIRAITAKNPKLVDKRKNEGMIALAEVPSRSNAVSCDSIDHVVLGSVSGPSELVALNGGSSEGQHIVDGALPVVSSADGTINLLSQPDIVNEWAKNSMLALLAVNREGKPRTLNVDRCTALRPTTTVMQPASFTMFINACPPPAPPGQR